MMPSMAASAFTGLPTKAKKKPHRGRKPSGKPGAKHLDLLNKAHAAGDHQAARSHALNYAKATMGVSGPTTASMDGDADDPVIAPSQPAPQAPAPKPATASGNRRMMLAKIAMGRRK